MQNTSNNAKPAVLTRSLNEIEKKKKYGGKMRPTKKKNYCVGRRLRPTLYAAQ